MPVLVTDEGVFAQSEWIVRYADGYLAARAAPDHDPEVVESAAGWTPGLGPDGRRLIYKHMLPRKRLMLPYNNRACRRGRPGR